MTSLRFESVTGEIKPVTIKIEPVDQTIDGLPDEIEEFEFTEVEMIIDFDTNNSKRKIKFLSVDLKY